MEAYQNQTIFGVADLQEEEVWLNEIVWKLWLKEDQLGIKREAAKPQHDRGSAGVTPDTDTDADTSQ